MYKSSCNSKGNRVIFKDFLRGSKIGNELFGSEFSAKKTRPTSRGRNFLTSSSFFPIFSAIDGP